MKSIEEENFLLEDMQFQPSVHIEFCETRFVDNAASKAQRLSRDSKGEEDPIRANKQTNEHKHQNYNSLAAIVI